MSPALQLVRELLNEIPADWHNEDYIKLRCRLALLLRHNSYKDECMEVAMTNLEMGRSLQHHFLIANSLFEISCLQYFYFKEVPKAQETLNEARTHALLQSDQRLLLSIDCFRARTLMNRWQLPEAEALCKQTLAAAEALQLEAQVQALLVQLNNIYNYMYLKPQSIAIGEALLQRPRLLSGHRLATCFGLQAAYEDLGNMEQHHYYNELTMELLAQRQGSLSQRMSMYQAFVIYYKEEEKFDRAYDCSLMYHSCFEETFNQERDKMMITLSATFEKQKAQQEILLAEAQQQLLLQELHTRQHELQLLATHVLQRNAQIGGFLQRIREGLQHMECEHGRLRPVSLLLQRLQHASRMQETLEQFDQQLLQTNRAFLQNLSAQFPALSKTELKLCSLLLLQLSNKDMANLLLCSVRTVENHRLRIQKKVALPHGQALPQWLQQFHETAVSSK